MAALHAQCFETAPRPWSVAEFAALCADPLVTILTDPHGFCVMRAIADEAELLTISVAPDARRQGIAAKLLDQAEQAMRADKVAQIFLEVAANNAPARALYGGRGFAKVGQRKGYYAGIDAYVLRKGL